MAVDLLCGDLAVCERVEEVMSEILTVEQVAEYRDSYIGIASLCDSHEALRAENERLKLDDDYVAWIRFSGRSIRVCDSDSPGAFRVWRRPYSRIAELEKERDAAQVQRDRAIIERDRLSRMVTALADTLDTTENERDGLRRALEEIIEKRVAREPHTSSWEEGFNDGLNAVVRICERALAAVPASTPADNGGVL